VLSSIDWFIMIGMKAKQIDDNWVLRFELGDNFAEALTQWANDSEVKSAFFHGLGGATNVTLGYYSLEDRQYHFKDFEGVLEVVSLHGNIAQKDGQVKLHAHGVISDTDFKTFGGHIKGMITGPTLELLVTPLSQELHRVPDEEVGLDLLDL